jgi:hypothetical protein
MSAFSFTSSHAPLLGQLHERLVEYEDAVGDAVGEANKYGHYGRGFRLDPTTESLVRRMRDAAAAFNAVERHVGVVDAHIDREYVVLNRDCCAPANELFRAPRGPEYAADQKRTVYTSSPILANASALDMSFRPHPSNEVLAFSPILANSIPLRKLAAPPPDFFE